MANPQKENGYTSISNELMEALAKIRISGEARQVLDFIFRKTYGWDKKEDNISLSQFVLGTGLKKVTICKAINKLELMNIITKKGNKKSNSYLILKNYELWKPLPKKITTYKSLPKKVIAITNIGNFSLPKKVHTITNNTITTITKDIEQSSKKIIPNLLIDKRKHIQIIGLFSRAKDINFESNEQISSFIKRYAKSAQSLVSYKIERIIDTMKYLKDNANFKWTLESVGKYIDEDLSQINNKIKTLKL